MVQLDYINGMRVALPTGVGFNVGLMMLRREMSNIAAY
jgi:hypothetical protein